MVNNRTKEMQSVKRKWSAWLVDVIKFILQGWGILWTARHIEFGPLVKTLVSAALMRRKNKESTLQDSDFKTQTQPEVCLLFLLSKPISLKQFSHWVYCKCQTGCWRPEARSEQETCLWKAVKLTSLHIFWEVRMLKIRSAWCHRQPTCFWTMSHSEVLILMSHSVRFRMDLEK